LPLSVISLLVILVILSEAKDLMLRIRVV